MKLLYIAGRYRGRNRETVDMNVQAARFMGALATERGWMPVIPHANTHGFEHLTDTHDEFWLQGTLEVMRRCDAVLLVPGWMESSGTQGEIKEARAKGIPVYFSVEDLPDAA